MPALKSNQALNRIKALPWGEIGIGALAIGSWTAQGALVGGAIGWAARNGNGRRDAKIGAGIGATIGSGLVGLSRLGR